MELVAATCPICKATREYGAELIGRYTHCQSCKARFYVEVPTLADQERAAAGMRRPIEQSEPPTATLDDLLNDSKQGTKHIIETLEQLQAAMRSLRWLVVMLALLGVANLAILVFQLVR